MHSQTFFRGIFSISLLTLLVALGCESAPSTSDKNLLHVDYVQLKEMIAGATEKRPVVIVDIRPAARYENGHIPGAINIPQGELKSHDGRFAKADKIVFYHESFTGLYSDLAAKKLIAEGVGNVYSYGGGWTDWQKRSGATE